MPEFAYKGKDRKGRKKKGVIEADNEGLALNMLKRQNIEVSSIKPAPKDLSEYLPMLAPKVTNKDIVIFTRTFATMIDAGLPLISCMEILYSQQENKTFRKIIRTLKEDVEGGASFAESLKKHPKVFDSLFVNLVAAGEAGGILDTILDRLAGYMEKAESLKKKVKGALTYPIAVIAIAIIVVAVILIFVIPVFQEMFADFGSALPMPTQIVVNMSDFLKQSWYIVFGAMVVAIFLLKAAARTEKGGWAIDRLVLRLPVFGDLIRKVAVARFTRTLGTMMSSGVPILDGLDIVAATAGNRVIEQAILETKAAIAEGRSVAEPLAESEVFPSMVVQMIGVGEATGALDVMLGKIADFYEEEVDAAVDALTSLLEPFLMVFLGGTIGGLVVAMYLPIFKMAGAVGG